MNIQLISLTQLIQKMIIATVKPYKFYILLLLLGAAGSLWTVSGTLPSLLYFLLINLPEFAFLTFVFLASWGMTLIIGSALGTASIVGVLFISIAKSAELPLPFVAGAILSGIYLGERTSPMSSCANLVAELTKVPTKDYIKANWINVMPSVCLTILLYSLLSYQMPMKEVSIALLETLQLTFTISLWTLLPLLVLMVCLVLKMDLIPSLMLSLLSSICFSVVVEQVSFFKLIQTGLTGYTADNSLHFLNSKGSVGMIKNIAIIAVATGLNELLRLTSMYRILQRAICEWAQKKGLFSATFLASLFGSTIGFSQTVSILITYEMTRDLYGTSEEDRLQQSLDIANSAVITPGLIPWNIAASAPGFLFALEPNFMPFAFFLLIAPLWQLVKVKTQKYFKKKIII